MTTQIVGHLVSSSKGTYSRVHVLEVCFASRNPSITKCIYGSLQKNAKQADFVAYE